MFLIEDDNFLQEVQKKQIDDLLYNMSFPMYFMDHGLDDDGKGMFVHAMLKRPEGETGQRYNSDYFNFFTSCFMMFCSKHDIKVNEILRSAVNCCYNNGYVGTDIHSDHEFEHKQFLLYLNDPEDKETPTIVYNKEETEILKKIYPKKYKGACFDGLPHTFNYPKKGLRWVAVFTFI
tara:strand:- start:162 stop:692 length:531 start_codon:yes stop_codon:yes gene_type:complete